MNLKQNTLRKEMNLFCLLYHFLLEEADEREVDFNQETLTFTIQFMKT